ncbi:MAG: DUF1302 domain-containing protein [Xanthomonadales bacterium]|nr:DUF1302 domain-containing protein [Xanthomonadales bacterium]
MNTKINRKLSLAVLGALACGGVVSNASAIEFGSGELTGSWDTTISYGASWRIEDRDESNVGKANLNPALTIPYATGNLSIGEQIAAPGRFSVNGDDGNLNYDDGDLISHALKITTELGFSYKNFGGFFRASGFYDFENESNDFLDVPDDRFGEPKEFVGSDIRLLDAFLYWDFDIGDALGTVRFGRQVVSWGESTFIQGGINVINPVDVSKLRVAGAELKEAFLPIDMIWTSFSPTANLSFEAVYMFEFEQIDPDPVGTYFATNDFGVPGGRIAMLGFGLVDEGFPPLTIPRTFDRSPDDDGQFGLAARYYAENFNNTEFGFYYLNYHSRLPLISGFAVENASPSSGRYFIEYPEDINLYGISFNTEIGGISFAGEVSYRDNLPLQIDDVEVLFSALTPLNAAIPAPVNRFVSQLGSFDFGEEIRGWEEHEVTQAQLTITNVIGPGNLFSADQWVMLAEIGAQKVWDLPETSVLRYNGPATDTGGGPSELSGGNLRNPVTTPDDWFADDFSWGYRFVTRLDYNSAFGTPWNLFPRLAFNHDVSGVSPGPGGSFLEDRKSLTLGLAGNYLSKWSADIAYTRFFGAGAQNELRDRDFVAFSVSYAF